MGGSQDDFDLKMPILCNLAEIVTFLEWRAAHSLREWKNSRGQSCFLAKYGNHEFHVGISMEAARWSVDEGQFAYRDMFKRIIWC